ncbi:MAG TPA: host attachment protein [Opitutus sp.]|nr:host attachment protein [Opitutus sp.]
MNEHFIVTIDRGHLRIYSETRTFGDTMPRLEIVEAMDFPSGHATAAEGESDSAHPFLGSRLRPESSSAEGPGSRREREKRNVAVLAAELDTFLQSRPEASWDFAATPALFDTVVEALSPETRRRLKRVLSKDLINQNSEEVRAHFATAGR